MVKTKYFIIGGSIVAFFLIELIGAAISYEAFRLINLCMFIAGVTFLLVIAVLHFFFKDKSPI